MSTTIPTVDVSSTLCSCAHTHPGSEEICRCVHRHAVAAAGAQEDNKDAAEGFLRLVEGMFTIVAKLVQALVFVIVLAAGGLVSSVRWVVLRISAARAERQLKKALAEEAAACAAEEATADAVDEGGDLGIDGDTEKGGSGRPSTSRPQAQAQTTVCSLCDQPAVVVWITSSDLILAECEDHSGSPDLKIKMGWSAQ